jgi:phosphoribosyl 1,2-cyclic phosphate phosphodiesterase
LVKLAYSRDIRGQVIFLGTGTSHGVPMIGCGCATCVSSNPRNQRTRSSILWGLPEGNLLIDTPPELRLQLTREGVGLVHAVALTHAHADHLFGLDDLRIFPRYLGHEVPLYCEEPVEASIRRVFAYAFDPIYEAFPAGGVPKLVFRRVAAGTPFALLGARVTPLRVFHGRQGILGFRIGNVAYCTDTKTIPPETMDLLAGLDVLILDGLRREPHVTHMSIDEAVEVSRQLAPRQTFFTHISHHLEHVETNRRLPSGMALAYDGLAFPLDLGDSP